MSKRYIHLVVIVNSDHKLGSTCFSARQELSKNCIIHSNFVNKSAMMFGIELDTDYAHDTLYSDVAACINLLLGKPHPDLPSAIESAVRDVPTSRNQANSHFIVASRVVDFLNIASDALYREVLTAWHKVPDLTPASVKIQNVALGFVLMCDGRRNNACYQQAVTETISFFALNNIAVDRWKTPNNVDAIILSRHDIGAVWKIEKCLTTFCDFHPNNPIGNQMAAAYQLSMLEARAWPYAFDAESGVFVALFEPGSKDAICEQIDGIYERLCEVKPFMFRPCKLLPGETISVEYSVPSTPSLLDALLANKVVIVPGHLPIFCRNADTTSDPNLSNVVALDFANMIDREAGVYTPSITLGFFLRTDYIVVGNNPAVLLQNDFTRVMSPAAKLEEIEDFIGRASKTVDLANLRIMLDKHRTYLPDSGRTLYELPWCFITINDGAPVDRTVDAAFADSYALVAMKTELKAGHCPLVNIFFLDTRERFFAWLLATVGLQNIVS